MTIFIIIFILIIVAIIILSIAFLIYKYYETKLALFDLHESQWKELKNKIWSSTHNEVDFGKYNHDKYIKVAGTLYENKKILAVDKAYEDYINGLINIKFLFIFNLGKNVPHKGRYPDD